MKKVFFSEKVSVRVFLEGEQNPLCIKRQYYKDTISPLYTPYSIRTHTKTFIRYNSNSYFYFPLNDTYYFYYS